MLLIFSSNEQKVKFYLVDYAYHYQFADVLQSENHVGFERIMIKTLSKITAPVCVLQIIILFMAIFCPKLSAQKNIRGNEFIKTENAYRANNLGVGLLEQFKFEQAEKEFRRSLEIKPDFGLGKINLAIALFNLKKFDEAKRVAEEYLKTEPHSAHTLYILGLINRTENRFDEALAYFKKVLEIDPNDVGANVNAGQILAQKRLFGEAIPYFERAYKTEPFNLTAIYNLATALQRSGEREKGEKLLREFQTLRDTSAGVNIGLNYLEQGKYAEAIASTGAENELVDKAAPRVNFADATGAFFGKAANISKTDAAALFDFDGDGDLDLIVSSSDKITLFRSDNGVFTEVKNTGISVTNTITSVTAIVAGDFDNDLKNDVLVASGNGLMLFHNDGNGKFSDVTNASKLDFSSSSRDHPILNSKALAFVDFDHDGDIDIFAGGGLGAYLKVIPNKLFRNNNDGTFTDVSENSKTDEKQNAEAVVPTDFNNTRDIDLLVVGADKTALYSNQRDDTFVNVADETNINFGGDTAAAGDVNKDGFTDFFIGRANGESRLFLSDGKGKFKEKKITNGKIFADAAQFLDFDNDGLLDLVTSGKSGVKIWRNLGNDWTEFKNNMKSGSAEKILSADFDGDGDLDLMLYGANQNLKIFRNDGGKNNSETLDLQGRVSNKSGIGAKILMRAGSLSQQLEDYAASPAPAPSEIHFGLGKRETADSIRILWSSGIVQTETDLKELQATKNSDVLKIEELDRKPASCPYLYTWNGEKFEFITDFLGGGEMGGWASSGEYHYPDSDEYVRIAPEKLKPRNGFYELRVTNELEEVMYLDKVKLIAIEHDRAVSVYPNEGLGQTEISNEKIFTTSNEHAPLSAINSNGGNILPKIKDLDRVFYDDFKSLPIRGYAKEHSMTLNLDDKKGFNGRTLLLLTGWTDYAFSSDNLGAAQSGKSLFFPYLQVKNKQGEWQTVIESIGISIGRPQTLVVDLTGKFVSDSREVRIVTNFKTYWDKIAVSTSEKSDFKTIEIEPTIADLRERGYSAETKIGGMDVPDYDKVSFDSRWKNFAGRFTQTGDVRNLLSEIDDVFAIVKAGDEFVLKFKELPTPPKGKVYTFLLYADGYSKEMDINSGSPDAVLPLPFKKMTKYPYGADEKYPMTDEKRKIYDETLTRFSRGGIASK